MNSTLHPQLKHDNAKLTNSISHSSQQQHNTKLSSSTFQSGEMDWLSLALFFILVPLSNFIRRNYFNRKNFPPAPLALPFIGHLHLLKQPLHQTLHHLSSKYGHVFLLQFGSRKVLVVSSPTAVEECFTKNDIVFANRPQLLAGKILNYNCRTIGFSPYGEQWRNLRRLASLELFSSARLALFTSIRQDEALLLLKQLYEDSIDKKEVKVKLSSRFVDLAFNIMMRMVAGKRYYGNDVVDEEANQFRDIMREFAEIHGTTNLNDCFPVLQWIDFQGVEKKMHKVMNKMDFFLQSLVDEHRKIRKQCLLRETEKKTTLIDVMLGLQEEQPEEYTDVNIKAVMLTVLVAGAETSSSTMEWAMSLLLNHPEKMNKVVDEIDTKIGLDRLLDEADLSRLSYLQNVVNETFRMYPVLPILLPHESSNDCSVCGFNVPKGTMLFVNLWTVHRDPKLWAEPNAFMPERFEGEEGEGYKLVPFGAGRRACPGAVVARRVIGLALAALIQAFEWGRIDDHVIDMSEGNALSLPKAQPLEVLCKPRPHTINLLSFQ